MPPAVAPDNHSLLGLSQDSSSPHNDENSQCTSQEPGADGVHRPSNDNEHDFGESVSEPENDMLQPFKEQEELLPGNMPSPSHSHRLISEPVCLQVDLEPDQSMPKVLRDASPPGTQSQKEGK